MFFNYLISASTVDPQGIINGFSIAFMVIMVLLSIAITVIVVLQQGNTNEMGAITGAADTFFGKNKSNTLDAKLKRWTVGIAIGLLVCSVLFFVLQILKTL